MMDSKFDDADSKTIEVDKRSLAEWFGVGIRTIENWLSVGVIEARLRGKRRIFDRDLCEQRLLQHTDLPKRRKK